MKKTLHNTKQSNIQKQKEIDTFIKKVKKVLSKYANYQKQNLIDKDSVEEINKFDTQFSKDVEIKGKTDRKLNIGVIGQVKAGKSSFLNMLLFEGKEMLPKAATPMTAALTRITYGETNKAKIEFYNKNEWQSIEKSVENAKKQIAKELAKEENELLDEEDIIDDVLSDSDKANWELVSMIQEKGINVNDYLGKTKTITANGADDLLGQLQNFVGAEGKFTPLVKSSELAINDEALKDINIIDTPGLNDPIVSRGKKTREFLGQCDVVFLLSYAGQFLPAMDISLLCQYLPEKGIKNENIIILSSKFDIPLYSQTRDKNKRPYRNIRLAIKGLKETLVERKKDVYKQTKLDVVNKANLEFMSSGFHSIALKKENNKALEPWEKLIIRNCSRAYNEMKGFSAQDFKNLGNIVHLHNTHLKRIKEEKEKTIAKAFGYFLNGNVASLSRILNDVKDSAMQRKSDLKRTSVDELEHSSWLVNKKINPIKKNVKDVFDKFEDGLDVEVKKEKDRSKNWAVHYKYINTRQNSEKVKVDTKKVEKHFTIFGWKVFRTSVEWIPIYETKYYYYASVQDSINNLEQLINKVQDNLNDSINDYKRSKVKKLKTNLKKAVKEVFIENADFDMKQIMKPTEKVIKKMALSDLILDKSKYQQKIIDKFGNVYEVEGKSRVEQLKTMHQRLINDFFDDLVNEVKNYTDQFKYEINGLKNSFLNDILGKFEEEQRTLKMQLENRHENIKKYESLLQQIEKDLIEIPKLFEKYK